jgi:predicted nucleic acid-binding protein
MIDLPNKRVYVDSNVLIYAVEGVPATAEPAKKLIKFLRAHTGLMFTSETLLPVTRDILIRTANLRKMTPLKLPDAIHLVSAIWSECRFLVTGDADFKKLPPGMKHVKPDEKAIENLLLVLA